MSRSGYVELHEMEPGQYAMFRGQVASAVRGRRGQRFIRDLADALDAMPDKLLAGHFVFEACSGLRCALGVALQARGVPVPERAAEVWDPDDWGADATRAVAEALDIHPVLAAEVVFLNDEAAAPTPRGRWRFMRDWCARHLRP